MLTFSGVTLAETDYSLRGFGTLGVTRNFSDGVAVIRDISQPDGPRGETSFDMDSRLGLQLDARFTPEFSATLQAISRYNYRGKYTPEVTLALLNYEVGNLQARMGRLGWDVYSMADSRDVGYAFLWVRPPVNYFGNLQVDHLDGADLRFSKPLGPGLFSAKIYAGVNGEKVGVDENSYSDQSGSLVYGGHMEYHYREWMGRLSYSAMDVESEIRGEQARQLRAIREFGDPQTVAFLKQFGLLDVEVETEVELISGSLVYESGPLQVQLMLSHDRLIDSYLGDKIYRGFVTTSYRLGDWTPYLTLASSRSPGSPIPDAVAASGAPTVVEDQDMISLGARYDFRKNMALKIQGDHFNVRRDGRSAILWRDAQDDWNGRVNQLSVTLDFIF